MTVYQAVGRFQIAVRPQWAPLEEQHALQEKWRACEMEPEDAAQTVHRRTMPVLVVLEKLPAPCL